MTKNEIAGVITAALFVAGDAIEISAFAQLLEIDRDELDKILQELIEEKENLGDGLLLTRVGDKVQLCTNAKYAEKIRALLAPDEHTSLSKSVLETLSIVAYKQPVTRAEIDEIRGVRSNYAVATLVEKGLIRAVGKKDVLGHPLLFATTDEFLRHFGISSIAELPEIDFEEIEKSSLA